MPATRATASPPAPAWWSALVSSLEALFGRPKPPEPMAINQALRGTAGFAGAAWSTQNGKKTLLIAEYPSTGKDKVALAALLRASLGATPFQIVQTDDPAVALRRTVVGDGAAGKALVSAQMVLLTPANNPQSPANNGRWALVYETRYDALHAAGQSEPATSDLNKALATFSRSNPGVILVHGADLGQ